MASPILKGAEDEQRYRQIAGATNPEQLAAGATNALT
jgi:nucleoside diphosphate kinase